MRLRRCVAFCVGLLALTHSGCSQRSELPVSIPSTVADARTERTRLASGLANPRGMLAREDGSIVIAIAGTGTSNTGAIIELRDLDRDGVFSVDEQRTILDEQPSANAINIVRRDEVFGVAAIVRGDQQTLATVAFFGGPSHVLQLDGMSTRPWGLVHGNLNSIAYSPDAQAWFAVSSTSDEVVRLRPEKGADRVLKLPPLAQGQDPVPGYLRYDPTTKRLLVSLFSGSVAGEEGGSGTEILSRAGAVVALDPQTRVLETIVDGLTTPTDLELDDCGRIYVLELCDDFLDPADSVAELGGVRHGGFRRYAGRLLRIDPNDRTVRVLVDQLDAPTNLARRGSTLLIAGGMGTPGRMIPGPNGAVHLEGYIDAIPIAPCSNER